MIHEFTRNLSNLWNTELRSMFFQIGLVLAGCAVLFVILLTTVTFVDPETFEEINVGFAGFIGR